MTKEEILELLKYQVLQVKDNSNAIGSNPNIFQDWTTKQKILNDAINTMNSCDANWLNDEYSKWFRKEIQPHIPKINPDFFKNQP